MKYLAVTRTTSMASLMYERDVLLRSIFMIVVLVVFVQLWSTTFEKANQAAFSGFELRDIMWYLVITESLVISFPRIVQTIDAEVRGGDVAYRLSRPYNYPLYHLASFWGDTLVRLPTNLLVGATIVLIAVGPPKLSVEALLATLLSAALAVTLVAVTSVMIGLSAFWVEDTTPIDWIYAKLVFTLGGMFLPLELFPDWLAQIARWLPFASMAYAPARLFVAFEWPMFGSVVLTQVVWLAALGMCLKVIFGKAVTRVVAHGG
jgi:ABC-2 type transport system permease protein